MWKGNKGPCRCYFCIQNKDHPDSHKEFMTEKRGHLQVAESLDPNDIVWTRMCRLCTHEVEET
jgi:hypothetical protein